MNEGVKILLERMKTNPEEFVDGLGIRMSKWGALLSQFREYLDEADLKLLEEAYTPLMQQHFTEQVMKELLAPEEDDGLGKRWYTKQSVMPLGGTTLGVTLNNSGTVTSWEEREPLAQNHQAHIDVHTKALQKQKPHKTLFGKLFTYL